MEDQTIIALFHARSEQAISALIAKYGASVRRITANILRDPLDVEESTNDTYFRIWNAIPPQVPKSLKAFSCAVARNTALDRFHANTAQKRNSFYDAALDELEAYIPALGSVESDLEAKELARCINTYLGTLCYDDRYMFLRRYYYADPVASIAASMGWTPHRVSVRLFRIREKLQKYLAKEGMLP